MCGRYMLTSPVEAIRRTFDVKGAMNLPARYNIAPGQQIPIVRAGKEGRELVAVEWGLVPAWMKHKPTSRTMINARAETIAEKPAFRSAFARRRCLVPANGFYEWQKREGGKIPMLVHLEDRALFAFAGIWEAWWGGDGDELLETAAIVTRAAYPNIAEIHDRMPVMLDEGDVALWLGEEDVAPAEVMSALEQRSPEELRYHAVSKRVNSVANDDASLIEEVPVPQQQSLL